MKKIILPCLLFLFASLKLPEKIADNWDRIYSFNDALDRHLTDVINLPTGDLAVIGYTIDGKLETPFFMTIDALTGKERNHRPLSENAGSVINSITTTNDGHLILAGSAKKNLKEKIGSGWLIKITYDGKFIDKTNYIEEGQFQFTKITSLDSGKYLLTGQNKRMAKAGMVWFGTVDNQLKITKLEEVGMGKVKDLPELQSFNGKAAWFCANSTKSSSGSDNEILLLKLIDSDLPVDKKPIIGSGNINSMSVTERGDLLLGGHEWLKGSPRKNGFLTSFSLKSDSVKKVSISPDLSTEVTVVNESLTGEQLFFERGEKGKSFYQTLYRNIDKRVVIDNFDGKKGDFFEAKKILHSYHGFYILAGIEHRSKKPDGIRLIQVKLKNENLRGKSITDPKLNIQIEKITVDDTDGSEILNPAETGTVYLKIKNNGSDDIIHGRIRVTNQSELTNIAFPKRTKFINYIEAGKEKEVFFKVEGLKDLKKEDNLVKIEISMDGYTPCQESFSLKTGEVEKMRKGQRSPFQIVWDEPDFKNRSSRTVEVNGKSEKIKFTILSSEPIDKHDVIIWNSKQSLTDDKSVHKSTFEPISTISEDQFQYEFEYTISDFVEDTTNMIRVQIKDAFPDSIAFVHDSKNLPNIHLLAIGPEYKNLKQTKLDVTDFEKLIKTHHNSGIFGKVNPTILVDSINTEKQDIEIEFNRLLNKFETGEIKQKDYLIIFYSGHGTRIDDGFYLVPSDYKEWAAPATTVDYKNLLERFLNKIHCKKLLFLDACLSGSASNDLATKNLSEETIADFLLRAGKVAESTLIFSSCSKTESSYEHSDWKNGAFTEALLEGLTGGTDEIPVDVGFYVEGDSKLYDANNSIISAGELDKFLKKRVPQLVKSKSAYRTQNPALELNGVEEDFPILTFEKK